MSRLRFHLFLALWAALASPGARAQTCTTLEEMFPATRDAIQNTARRYWEAAARADTEALRQAAIPAVAAGFQPIADAVRAHRELLATAQPTLRAAYLLETDGDQPQPRVSFYCGVYRTPGWLGFTFTDLEPGRYAVVLFDLTAPAGPHTFSLVLRQEPPPAMATPDVALAQPWNLAGLYLKPSTLMGHDAQWFLEKARAFQLSGQPRNAWFYYLLARDLLAPVPFIGTELLDNIYDEQQQVRPAELPYDQPLSLAVGGRSVRLTHIFPVPAEQGLLLVLKYEAADVSDSAKAGAQNLAVSRAFLARFPEYRNAFEGVVARAVEPSGRDYGSLVMMKDLAAGPR
ncbi:MAG TPA: hypothetical protein VNK82_02945 [Terriglobales bacterium]|nr:hypothetical protein [Terriglobales bacterium]